MDKRFAGRVAMVTGAAGGIGAVIAQKFAEYGADVVIADIKIDEESEVFQNIRAMGRKVMGIHMDITNVAKVEEDVAKIVAEMGKIDFLINNAGVYPARPMMEGDEKLFDFVIGVNLKGMYFVTQNVVKQSMLPNGFGRIVSISSIDGKKPAQGVGIYGAAKAGVIAMSNSFALELAGTNINSNVVAPGWVESAAVLASDRWKMFLDQIPARRLGKLTEIAEACCFLCDEKVSFINGETLDVNGGQIMD